MISRTIPALLLLFVTGACLSQSAPPQIRWFLPVMPTFDRVDEPAGPLRVMPVRAAAHLRGNMVWRLSEVEIFLDERENWGVQPSELVYGAVESAFYESGAFSPSEDIGTPSLALEVRAFEGVYGGPDIARISLFTSYFDGTRAHQRTFTTDMPLESREADELARGIGEALRTCVTDLKDWVLSSP